MNLVSTSDEVVAVVLLEVLVLLPPPVGPSSLFNFKPIVACFIRTHTLIAILNQ
ncbi:hypothetical protein Hanom_Chr00s000716g01655651 [Helianthus anomalus]